MADAKNRLIKVPLWRPLVQCFLDSFLGVLLGIAFIASPEALRSPAYAPLQPFGHTGVGLLFLIPGLIASTLLVGGHRKNAFIPLLILAGIYSMFTVLLILFSILHPAAWEAAALFGIFAASTIVQAFSAADLP